MRFWVLFLALFHTLCTAEIRWHGTGVQKMAIEFYRENVICPDLSFVDQAGLSREALTQLFQNAGFESDFGPFRCGFDLQGTMVLTPEWQGELLCSQGFIEAAFGNWILLIGRSIRSWGTGYSRNPSDVVGPQKELSDPENREGRLSGTDMILAEFFTSSFSLSAGMIGRMELRPEPRIADPGLALRVYRNLAGIDLSLIALFGRNKPVYGLNFALVAGRRLELHGELRIQMEGSRPFHACLTDEDRLYATNPVGLTRTGPFFEWLAGFQFTWPWRLFWVLEWVHQSGLYAGEWNRMMDHVRYLRSEWEHGNPAAGGNLLWAWQIYSSRGAGRDYLFFHLAVPAGDRIHLTLNSMVNASDLSAVWVPEAKFDSGNRLSFYCRCAIFQGSRNSEFGSFFQNTVMEGGLRLR